MAGAALGAVAWLQGGQPRAAAVVEGNGVSGTRRGLGDLGLERESFVRDKHLVGSSKEGTATLFSVGSGGRIRDNGHKLKWEIPLKYANRPLRCEGDGALGWVAREAAKSPRVVMLGSQSRLLQLAVPWATGGTPQSAQVSPASPPQGFCDPAKRPRGRPSFPFSSGCSWHVGWV